METRRLNNTPPAYGRYALTLLLAVNLLNYIDRQVIYAVFPLVKTDLRLSDTALGFLGSAFMLCYMISAPFFGWIGDRMNRAKLAASGLALWSLATLVAGTAFSYRTLVVARTMVGVGEASFGTVSPGLLCDYFPRERRGRILSYFFLAIPVGSALGYLLGGILGHTFGWHSAFLIVGAPGLILSLFLVFLKEPLHRDAARNGFIRGAVPLKHYARESYFSLLSNRSFVITTLSMAAMTFALGGLAQWAPTFLYRTHALDVAGANTLFGAITVLSGIIGTLLGGWIGDYLQQKSGKGYLIISGWGFLLGTPIAAYALITPSLPGCLLAIFLAELFLFLSTGPLNTVIANVTGPGIRAMAFAVNIFFIHALGDAISPTLLGWLSDKWGLSNALLVTPFALLLAALFSFSCRKFIDLDSAKVVQQELK